MLRPLLRLGVHLAFVCLVAESLLATSPNPVGTLRAGARVYVDGTPAEAETTLYSGDRLQTDDTPATVSLPHGDLLMLSQQSQTTLQNSDGTFQIDLEKGRVVLSTTARKLLRVVSQGVTFTPAEAFPSIAEIALGGDGSMFLAVRRGTVSVSDLGGKPVAVTAGQSLNISPRLAQSQQGSRPIGTGAHGKMTLAEKLRTFQLGHLSHGASVAIVGGIVGGVAATVIIVPLATCSEPPVVSPAAPNPC